MLTLSFTNTPSPTAVDAIKQQTLMDINRRWHSSARMIAQAGRRFWEDYILCNLFNNAIWSMLLHVLAWEELLGNASLVPCPVVTLIRIAGLLPRHT